MMIMYKNNLATKIFLDSGDVAETKKAMELLGFLDGQTTNPSLIAKSPGAQERLARGEKFSKEEVYGYYKKVVQELSELLPNGSISVEVYADAQTTSEEMYAQGKEMNTWIPNAHIKLPITAAGLTVAEKFVREGIRINMTLCFSQEQAAAVYAATRGAQPGDVFVSPFIGRLDDRGENGVDLIQNILQMYAAGDGHVQVLAASLRNFEHLLAVLALRCDIATLPFKVIGEFAASSLAMPAADFQPNSSGLVPIVYQEFDLQKHWRDFNIEHELTDKGIEKFAADWNALIK